MPLFMTCLSANMSPNADTFKNNGYPIVFNRDVSKRFISVCPGVSGAGGVIAFDGRGTKSSVSTKKIPDTGYEKFQSGNTVGTNNDCFINIYETTEESWQTNNYRNSIQLRGLNFARISHTSKYVSDSTGDLPARGGSSVIDIDVNLPIGTILMFNASFTVTTSDNHNRNSSFPKGWYVCNGTNGTPNLIDKFVKGMTAAGATGGSHTITLSVANLPAHTHGLNGHTHTINHDHASFTSGNSPSLSHNHTGTCNTAGSHTHTANHFHSANAENSVSHSHTANHTHTASLIPNGGHTHTIPSHTHTMAHGHTVSVASALGSHTHTTDIRHGHELNGTSYSVTNYDINNQYVWRKYSSPEQHYYDSATYLTASYLKQLNTNSFFYNYYMVPHGGGENQTEYKNINNVRQHLTSFSHDKFKKRSQTDTNSQGNLQGATSPSINGASYISIKLNQHNSSRKSDSVNLSHKHDVTIGNFDGSTGGSGQLMTSTMFDHSHTITINKENVTTSVDGVHNHKITVYSENVTTSLSGSHSHTITVGTNSLGTHTHSIDVPNFTGSSGGSTSNTTSTGLGQSFNNQPAFYTVVFIMRVS